MGELPREACASPLAPVANVEDLPHVALVGDDAGAVLTLQPETHYVHHGDLVLRGTLVVEPPSREASIFRLTVLGDFVVEGEIIALPAATGERAPLVRDGTSIVLEATENLLVREGASIVAASGVDGWTSVVNGAGLPARGQDGGHGGSIALWAEGVRVGHEQVQPGRGGRGGDAFAGLSADAFGGEGGDGGTATANGAVMDGASAGDGGSATAGGGCFLCDVFAPQTTSDDCDAQSRNTAPKDVTCLIPTDDGGSAPDPCTTGMCQPQPPSCDTLAGCTGSPPPPPTGPSAPSGPTAPSNPCPPSMCYVPPPSSPSNPPTAPSSPPPPSAPTNACPSGVCYVPPPSTSPTQPTGPTSCGDACAPTVPSPTPTTYPTATTTVPTSTTPTPPGGVGVPLPNEYLAPPGIIDVNLGDCRSATKGRDGQGSEDGESVENKCAPGAAGRNGDPGLRLGPLCTSGTDGEPGGVGPSSGNAVGGDGGSTYGFGIDIPDPGRGGDATSFAGAGGPGGYGGNGYAGLLLTCPGGNGGPGGSGGKSGDATGGNGGRSIYAGGAPAPPPLPPYPVFIFGWKCGGGGFGYTNAAVGGAGGEGGEPGGRDGAAGGTGARGVEKEGLECPED